MGFENRDYARDGSYSRGMGGGFLSDAPVCKRIIIATVCVFIAQIFFTRAPTDADFRRMMERVSTETPEVSAEDFQHIIGTIPRISIVDEWLNLDTEKVLQGQVWRLLTNAFCHDRFGVWHILINMLLLFWFGATLESLYGSKEFLQKCLNVFST